MKNLQTPIGEILKAAGAAGVLVEAEGRAQYAMLPLDDDLLEYLLEHHPRFIEDCRQIRARMDLGQSYTHEEVRRLLSEEEGTSVKVAV